MCRRMANYEQLDVNINKSTQLNTKDFLLSTPYAKIFQENYLTSNLLFHLAHHAALFRLVKHSCRSCIGPSQRLPSSEHWVSFLVLTLDEDLGKATLTRS